ncbi:MAG: DUF1949 domain-containing protein, partial [Lachnospiraceae bacterium]|nr:DUF1949 domain-containing protein [Lachnospiraceae bacterium]
SQAVKEGLKNCVIGVMRAGVRMKVETDYNNIGRILYLLGSRGIEPQKSEYTDKVTLELLFPAEWKEALTKEFTEATAGRAVIEVMEELYYVDKEV